MDFLLDQRNQRLINSREKTIKRPPLFYKGIYRSQADST